MVPEMTDDGRPIIVIYCCREIRSNCLSHCNPEKKRPTWVKSARYTGAQRSHHVSKGPNWLNYLPQNLQWTQRPVVVEDNVTHEQHSYESLPEWMFTELELVATGRKILQENRETRDNVLVVRHNELISSMGSVLVALKQFGLKPKTLEHDEVWPLVHTSNVKIMCQETDDMYETEKKQSEEVDISYPMHALWSLNIGDDESVRRRWSFLYQYFHWTCNMDRELWKNKLWFPTAGSNYNIFKLLDTSRHAP